MVTSPLTNEAPSNNLPAQPTTKPTSGIGSEPSAGFNGQPPAPAHSTGLARWQLGIIIPICIIVVVAVVGGLLYLYRKKSSRKPRNREQQPEIDPTGPNQPPENLPLTRYNLQRHEQRGPGWHTLRTVRTFRWGHPPSTHRDDGQGLELRPMPATASRQEPQPPPPPATERQPVEARAGTSPCPQQSPTRTPRGNRAGDNAEQVYVDMRQAQNVTVQIHGSDGAQRHARDDSGYASNLPPSPLRRSPERHARAELHGEPDPSPLRRSPERRPAWAELHSEPDFTTPLDFGRYRR